MKSTSHDLLATMPSHIIIVIPSIKSGIGVKKCWNSKKARKEV
jgi:hypothetical protein